jgi:triacylglycerol lipase
MRYPYPGPKPALVLGLALLLACGAWAAPGKAAQLAAFLPEPSRNDCPVILVHGILAYGQDERLPVSAWGGMGDYRLMLAEEGWRIFSATMGPLSSNWDRACELYAYIKGGITDYGAAHSARCGHDRFGRGFPGVHPSWGQADKVHLLCHSMGGQTARLLVQLLQAGAPEELAAAPEDASPLFEGGHSWVLGLVTLCSPHDGSSLSLVANYGSAAAKKSICAVIAAASPAYDAGLAHRGLARREGESAFSYAARLEADVSWYLGEDACYRDLRPAGAAELNTWVKAWPDVYYFSWAASDSYEFEGRQLPSVDIQPLLAMSSLAMGSFSGTDGPWEIGRSWEENDGTVNTVSMDGPKLNSADRILPFSGKPLRGAWNFMGKLTGTDHVDLLGFATPLWYAPPGFESIEDWYRYNLRLLASLED